MRQGYSRSFLIITKIFRHMILEVMSSRALFLSLISSLISVGSGKWFTSTDFTILGFALENITKKSTEQLHLFVP